MSDYWSRAALAEKLTLQVFNERGAVVQGKCEQVHLTFDDLALIMLQTIETVTRSQP